MQALHGQGLRWGHRLLLSYLTVGSRPFAAVQAPGNQASGPTALVLPQLETDLRQTKWQKIRNPPTTSTVVPIGFHPYTLIQTNGPATTGVANRMWQRVWEGRRWMPFTWAQIGMPGAGAGGIAFYGPYVVVDTPGGGEPRNPRRDRGVHPTHDRPVPRPEISKLHRGADLGSECPPGPLGHTTGLAASVRPRYAASGA